MHGEQHLAVEVHCVAVELVQRGGGGRASGPLHKAWGACSTGGVRLRRGVSCLRRRRSCCCCCPGCCLRRAEVPTNARILARGLGGTVRAALQLGQLLGAPALQHGARLGQLLGARDQVLGEDPFGF